MIRHIIGHWLSFLLPTFYKRIQVHNVHHLYIKDPIIIAMNHPNAFTDPIAISYHTYPLRLYYMARGDAFKPGIIAWLLEKIGIVPIFRIQDAGKEGLKRNEDAYRRVNRLLQRNGKVIVFAEGLCIQERRLRPLKKGVARMVFGSYDHLGHDKLKVIPVGVNYSKPDKFRSKLLYNVGEPIAVRDYIEAYRENPARAYNAFLQDLEKAMLEQVIHIPSPEMDDTVHYAEKLVMADSIRQQGLPPKALRSEFIVSRQLIEKITRAAKEQSSVYQSFKEQAGTYFATLKKLKLKDWLFRPRNEASNSWLTWVLRILWLIMLSPVYVTGMIFNFPPLLLTHLITSGIISAVEFYASIALGVAMVLFLLFYVAWGLVFYAIFDNLLLALGCCIIVALCGWACLHLHPFLLRTIGLGRFLMLGPQTAQLKAMRASLVAQINKF